MHECFKRGQTNQRFIVRPELSTWKNEQDKTVAFLEENEVNFPETETFSRYSYLDELVNYES